MQIGRKRSQFIKENPFPFKRLSYIRSTSGKAHCTLPIYPCSTTNSELRLKIGIPTTTYADTHCFGSGYGSDDDIMFAVCTWYDSNATYRFLTTNGWNNIVSSKTNPIINVITSPSIGTKIYDETGKTLLGTINGTFWVRENLRHVGVGRATYVSSCATNDVYYFSQYIDGEMVSEFIPCINDDNIVGLYDTVNKQFYSSTTSTAFIGGGNYELITP